MKAFNFFSKDPSRSGMKVNNWFVLATLVLGVVFYFNSSILMAHADNGPSQQQDQNSQSSGDNGSGGDNHGDGDGNSKVTICHKNTSDNDSESAEDLDFNPWTVINIKSSDLQSHLDSGDFLYAGPKGDEDGGYSASWCKDHAPKPKPTKGSIEIKKYVCPADTVVIRSANGVGKSVPESCTPQDGKTFGYVHGTQTDANGPYPELSTALTAGGSTVNGVLTIKDLLAAGRYLIEETNSDNQRLSDSDILGLYCEGDGDTSNNNDNQELTFVPAGGVAHCVAYDKAPVPPPVDLCPNIPGIQAVMPEGKHLVDGQCVDIVTPPTDVCPNIDGVQTVVPDGYHLDSDNQCVPNVTSGGGGGGGGNYGHPTSGGSSGGSVLGASTSCGIYLEDYMKMGAKNNVDQVKKLQEFLNSYLKLDPQIPVNGFFGIQTFDAVVKFQESEANYVLKPWVGITLKDTKHGTGYVFKTTLTRINNIECPELNLTPPALTLN